MAESGPRSTFRAALVGVLSVASLWQAWHPSAAGAAAEAALLVSIAVVGWTRAPQHIRVTAAVLGAVAACLLPFCWDPLPELARGVHIGGLLVALLASVSLLGACAERSPAVRRVGLWLVEQPGRRQYLAFTLAGQLFAAMLNLAGTNLLCTMAAYEPCQPRSRRIFSAIGRGFGTAICWSPMFGNMSILLSLYPSLDWLDVLPYGLLAAQGLTLVGVLVEHSPPSAPAAARVPVRHGRPPFRILSGLAGALTLFLVGVVALHTILGGPIGAAIVIAAPAFAVLWEIAERHRARPAGALKQLRLDAEIRFPGMSAEALLFTAAGIASGMLVSSLPDGLGIRISGLFADSPAAAAVLPMFVMLIVSMLGVHPILTAMLLPRVLSPDLLHVSPMLHMLSVLTGWAIAVVGSPFTVVSMMLGRYARVSPHTVSLIWNWRFLLASTALVGISLALASLGISALASR